MLYRSNFFVIETDISLCGWERVSEEDVSEINKFFLVKDEGLSLQCSMDEWPYIKYSENAFNIIWREQFAYSVDLLQKRIYVKKNRVVEDIYYTLSLNFVLSIIALYNGYLPLHSAAAESPDGKIIVFLGDSGVGKSTLLLNLVKKGWKFISEELCIIDPRRNYSITCGCKLIRLKKAVSSAMEDKELCWFPEIKSIDTVKKVNAFIFLLPEKMQAKESFERALPQEAFNLLTTKYIYTKGGIAGELFRIVISAILKFVFLEKFYFYKYPFFPSLQFIEKIVERL